MADQDRLSGLDETGEATGAKAKPRSPKQLALDAVWEALVDECGIERPAEGKDYPEQLKRRIVKARKEIIGAGDPPSAAEVFQRAAEYRSRFPGLDLTLEAFAKHWSTLRPTVVLDETDPVIGCLIDVFGIERPGEEGAWPRSIAVRIASVAQEISLANGAPTPEEIKTRAHEYRRRFPGADFSLEAFARHWLTLRAGTTLDTGDPVIAALLDLFVFERPAAGGEWPVESVRRLSHAAQEISAAQGPPDRTEIAKRISEYRHRWPERELTLEALVRHWAELAHTAVRVSADRTVSEYPDGWNPGYATPEEGALGPVRVAPIETSPGGRFDIAAYHRAWVLDEQRREAKKLFEATRPKWAVHATSHSLITADPPYDPDLLRSIRPWVVDPSPYLVLYGPPGTGKSWIAMTIANRFVDNGTTTMFIRYGDLMNRIRAEWKRESEPQPIMELVTGVGLLVLDDLGAIGDIHDWQQPYFDSLLNQRLDADRPTVLTTNLRSGGGPDSPSRSQVNLGDLEAHIGKRFTSRFSLGLILAVDGPDRRQMDRRLGETRETTTAIRHGGAE